MAEVNLTDGFVYGEGVQRTNVDCTNCGKIFIAKINFDVNGNHRIVCPLCGHQHYRVIKNGVVTGDRFSSQAGPNVEVPTERCWSDKTTAGEVLETSSAARYIRDRWLEKGKEG